MRVLFVGKKRAGKDEAVKFMLKEYGGIHESFAKPVYEFGYAILRALGLPEEKHRKLLQTIGEWARINIDEDIWVDQLLARMDEADPRELSNVFISDGRYLNELEIMRDCGYVLIKVECDEAVRVARLDPNDSAEDSHSSENGYPEDFDFDFVVDNSTTLEDYHKRLAKVVDSIKRSK